MGPVLVESSKHKSSVCKAIFLVYENIYTFTQGEGERDKNKIKSNKPCKNKRTWNKNTAGRRLYSVISATKVSREKVTLYQTYKYLKKLVENNLEAPLTEYRENALKHKDC